MKRKHEAKNDFFYAFVMFAMFAVVVFNVAAEFFHRSNEAYFVQFDEAFEPRMAQRELTRMPLWQCARPRGRE